MRYWQSDMTAREKLAFLVGCVALTVVVCALLFIFGAIVVMLVSTNPVAFFIVAACIFVAVGGLWAAHTIDNLDARRKMTQQFHNHPDGCECPFCS